MRACLTVCLSGFLIAGHASAQNASGSSSAQVHLRLPLEVTSPKDSPFAYSAEFVGEIILVGDSAIITLRKAVIRLRSNLNYQGVRDLRDMTVRFARLASNPPNWETEAARALAQIGRSMRPGDEIQLDSMRLAVARPSQRPLAAYWLVFQLRDFVPDRDGRIRAGFTPIHSRRDIFHR
jgi:hypothetical protein